MAEFWIWIACRDRTFGFLLQVRVCEPDVAVLRDDLAEYEHKLRPASAYAALIAAISGPIPRMAMTRFRL